MIYPKTLEGYSKVAALDKTFLGTPDYMGVVYFWAMRYKHHLRDCSATMRKRVHDRFVSAGLVLFEESAEHDAIMNRTFKCQDYKETS